MRATATAPKHPTTTPKHLAASFEPCTPQPCHPPSWPPQAAAAPERCRCPPAPTCRGGRRCRRRWRGAASGSRELAEAASPGHGRPRQAANLPVALENSRKKSSSLCSPGLRCQRCLGRRQLAQPSPGRQHRGEAEGGPGGLRLWGALPRMEGLVGVLSSLPTSPASWGWGAAVGAACAPSPTPVTLPLVSPRAPSPPAPPQPRSVLPERGSGGAGCRDGARVPRGRSQEGAGEGDAVGGVPEAARCLPADVPTCSARPAPPFPQVPPFPSGCRSRRLSRLPGVTQPAPKDGNGETEARCPQGPGKQHRVGGNGQEDVPQPQEVPRGRQRWSHVASRPTPPGAARKGNVLWNWKKKGLPASPGPASSSARPCVSWGSAGAPPPGPVSPSGTWDVSPGWWQLTARAGTAACAEGN